MQVRVSSQSAWIERFYKKKFVREGKTKEGGKFRLEGLLLCALIGCTNNTTSQWVLLKTRKIRGQGFSQIEVCELGEMKRASARALFPHRNKSRLLRHALVWTTAKGQPYVGLLNKRIQGR